MTEDDDSTREPKLCDDPDDARELEVLLRAERLVEGLSPEELHSAIMHALSLAGAERLGAWGEAWNAVAAALKLPIPSMYGQNMPGEKAWAVGACAAAMEEWRARSEDRKDKGQADRRRAQRWNDGERHWAEQLRSTLARVNPSFRQIERSYVLRSASDADSEHGSTMEAAYTLVWRLSSKVDLDWTLDAIKKAHKRLK